MFNNVLHRNRVEDERVVEERDANGNVVAERTEDRDASGRVVAERTARVPGRTAVAERPAVPVTEPVTEPVAEPVVEQRRWAHNSFSAVLGLVLGVVAVGTVLTGLLAPLGVAIGVIGAVISVGGLVSASRRGVTGHGAAFGGTIASVAAIILGVLAIQGELSWLNSHTDEVARLHNWLVATFPWTRNW
jgi:hypothetical protein